MILILTVTIPIFIVISAGYVSARMGMMTFQSIRAFTSFVFYFCLPLMLFHSLASAPVAEQFDSRFVIAYLCASLTNFFLGYLLARWVFDCNASEQVVLGLAVSFGHTVFMAIPISTSLYGEASNLPVALLIAVEIGVIVPLAVVMLEIENTTAPSMRSIIGTAFRSVVTSPIVLAIIFGISVALLDIELPAVLDGVVNLVRGATIPCALYAIGASLHGLPFGNRIKQSATVVLGKLVMYPVLVYLYMSVFPGISTEWKNIAIISAATPVGASVYLVASTYNSYVERASAVTLISTILSVITLSALVIMLA